MNRFAIALVVCTTFASTAWAAPQTVVLSIPGMSCSSCPLTVKMALKKVSGVTDIDVAYKEKKATVTFDDERATLKELTQATAEAGYPSSREK